jgi:mandelamide amidase
MSGSLAELSASAAVKAMRHGELSCEDYARALLDRAHQLESLNAFRTINAEMVMEAARTADQRRGSGAVLGALHGLPIPVKDSVNSKQLPSSSGTGALRTFMPKEDAKVLRILLSEGAILMGKTNLHELSFGRTSNNGLFGPVHNPYDPNRIPGGSSGGSGAAVAARMAPLAVAGDTWGSIRVPATMCGLAGLRPSFGRYPNDGVMPLTEARFDQIGPLARSVLDLALFDAAVTGRRVPLKAAPLSGARIAIAGFLMSGLDSEVLRIVDEALNRLRAAGVTIVEAELSEELKRAADVAGAIVNYEAMPAISTFLREQGTGVSFDRLLEQASPSMREELIASVVPPHRPTPEEYQAALAQREAIRLAIPRYFEQHRIVAMAFAPSIAPPPLIGEDKEIDIGGLAVTLSAALGRNTALASCTSMAALVLPAGLTSNGLPIGIEFDAPEGRDHTLLCLGLSLERTLGPISAPQI